MREYRFTNVFRAADRVSQYLIREIQYHPDRSQEPAEIFFRTLLFKLFNRVETWQAIEQKLGPITWHNNSLEKISNILDAFVKAGMRIYSAAYIMPSPSLGHPRKHTNHLAILAQMMSDGLPARLARAHSLRSAYEMIRGYPGFGPFLAFQYTIDLNYSTLLDFDEAEFVVAGPGALDGISKCFENSALVDPARLIYMMVDDQTQEFARLGLEFNGLFGRLLQPIDCQNLFCEISKYARVAHPDISGLSGRRRIKQRYKPAAPTPVNLPFFPPKWNLRPIQARVVSPTESPALQLSLL